MIHQVAIVLGNAIRLAQCHVKVRLLHLLVGELWGFQVSVLQTCCLYGAINLQFGALLHFHGNTELRLVLLSLIELSLQSLRNLKLSFVGDDPFASLLLVAMILTHTSSSPLFQGRLSR